MDDQKLPEEPMNEVVEEQAQVEESKEEAPVI